MSDPLPNRTEPLPEKRYYDPSTEDNWADILHAVLEEISVNSLVSGTDHTDFKPVDGQLFVPTNGGKWYLGDGESWNEVATSGGGGGGLGGKETRTGDGTTTTFQWSSGVADPADLEYASIDAASEAASTDFSTFINGTDIGVEYARAPADGATLAWFWSVNTTVTDSHTHEGDDLIPTSVMASTVDTSGLRTDRLQDGSNPSETISGTGASLQFTGDSSRDIHDATDVTLSNSSGASVTEDVTVDYYQGIDNTGTLEASETQSVTLANGASTTNTYLTADFALDNVDYYIEVTTTNLTADSIDEHTLGAEYVTKQTSTGDLVTTDQNGRERARYDATSETVSYPSAEVDVFNSVVSVTSDMSSADINAAITNDLPAEGGVVEFRPGTYTVDGEPIDLSKPYLYFRGLGDVSIGIASTFQSNIIANTADQNNEFFGMSNLELVGNRASDGSNEDTAASQAGVRAQHTRFVSVEDVRIADTVDSSLNVGGGYTDFLFVRSSRFEYAGHLNHASTDAHIVAPGSSISGTEIHITDCHFDWTTDNAIYLNNCVSASVAGCRFHDCFVNAADSNMNNVKYVGCDITGSPPRGNAHFYFPVGGSQSITIRDCDWHDLGTMPSGFDNAIYSLSGLSSPIEDVLIDGCTFTLNNEINAFRWQDRGEGIRFRDNHIIDPAGGASRCDDSIDLSVTGNTVKYTSDATSTSGNTLMLVNVSNSRLADNHVIDNRASTDSITNAYRVADTGNGNAGMTIVENNTAVGTSGETHNVDLDYAYLRYNGLGYNAGDPSSTGQWNTNGIEGLIVRDTTNAATLIYNNGVWRTIASS